MKQLISEQHKKKSNNYVLSPALEQVAMRISKEAGGNVNNQVRVSHGIQVALLRYAKEFGLEYEKYYK